MEEWWMHLCWLQWQVSRASCRLEEPCTATFNVSDGLAGIFVILTTFVWPHTHVVQGIFVVRSVLPNFWHNSYVDVHGNALGFLHSFLILSRLFTSLLMSSCTIRYGKYRISHRPMSVGVLTNIWIESMLCATKKCGFSGRVWWYSKLVTKTSCGLQIAHRQCDIFQYCVCISFFFPNVCGWLGCSNQWVGNHTIYKRNKHLLCMHVEHEHQSNDSTARLI